ncbi:MAG: hypothetical protein A3D31_03425 [Candidatus Fluviicola riflensis]|nr:MAG: hypothetical protein CHH17_11605 [Candidatus Fluviicola riflensis]OGS79031.1 MAG: hypothetical protein A3D31_03425 [Candidatus Fluviicola riflensis]OGS86054.1 MAG: hypothetical protein A3E30_10915 [Fluviicola sp. RIFCSPHIGHO2_12_FULL_43_24]OGS86463.1 MAG: hypothetical protein A2724_02885 [Fluviicola sp. RIFCSPHIGHO2_01_FULL_43_53]
MHWRHPQTARKKGLFLCFQVKSVRSGSGTQALLTKHNGTAFFFASLPGMTPVRSYNFRKV